MRPLRFALASLLLLLLVPGVAAAAWSQPGYSAANLFSSPVDGPLSPANIAEVESRWTWEVPGDELDSQAVGPVVVADGIAFVHVDSQSIVARDAATGAAAWEADLGPTGVRDLAAFGRTLYAQSGGRLVSFPTRCRTDGGQCTPRVMAEGGYGAPVITAGRVLARRRAEDGDRLVAFDRSCLRACTPVWQYRYNGSFLSEPSAANGMAWVGTSGGSLVGFRLDCASGGGTCQPDRRAAAAGRGFDFFEPAVTSARVYARDRDRRIYAFPAGCEEVCGAAWRSAEPGYEQPAVTGSRVFAARNDLSGTPRLDVFSTACAPVAGKCSARASTDLGAGDAAGDQPFGAGAATVADGMVFVPIVGPPGGPGGVKVFPTSCDAAACPSLRRLGNLKLEGWATVSGGLVYLVEEIAPQGGTDPGPFTSYVRAFGLPD